MNYIRNKAILFLLSVTILGSVSAAQAADGTINFTGSISEQACTISSASQIQTVSLGPVSKGTLANAGDVSEAKIFSIQLDGCPDSINTVQVTFDGTPHSVNSNILALNNGSTATNVGVALYEKDGVTQIPLRDESVAEKIIAGAATLQFVAKYMATALGVTAGIANASTDFTITYR